MEGAAGLLEQPEGTGPEAGQWRRYPRKPVTFPNQDRMDRYTNYCKARKVNFSALVRKLLDREMREHPAEPPGPPTIRVIKEPER